MRAELRTRRKWLRWLRQSQLPGKLNLPNLEIRVEQPIRDKDMKFYGQACRLSLPNLANIGVD